MEKRFFSLILITPFIAACAPMIVGGAATVGYMAVQERGAKAAVSDMSIKTGIKDRLTGTKFSYLSDVGVYVLEGHVLLVGAVPSEQDVTQAGRVVKNAPHVRQVFNELQVDPAYSGLDYAKDAWISTQLKSRMATATDVYTINYSFETVNGHVYMLGLATSEGERERALHLARTTKGVETVHNYIRVVSRQESKSITRKFEGSLAED